MKLSKKNNEKLTEKNSENGNLNCGTVKNETIAKFSDTEKRNNFLENEKDIKFQTYENLCKILSEESIFSKTHKRKCCLQEIKKFIKIEYFNNCAQNINKNNNPASSTNKKSDKKDSGTYNPYAQQDTSNLTPAERLEQARKTRLLQIQHYQEYEKKHKYLDKKKTQSYAKL